MNTVDKILELTKDLSDYDKRLLAIRVLSVPHIKKGIVPEYFLAVIYMMGVKRRDVFTQEFLIREISKQFDSPSEQEKRLQVINKTNKFL